MIAEFQYLPFLPYLLAAAAAVAVLWVFSKYKRGERSGKLIFIFAALVATVYGGAMRGSCFRFITETGVYDAGSYIDENNGVAYAVWDYEPYLKGHTFKWFYQYKIGKDKFGPYPMMDVPIESGSAMYIFNIPEGEEWRDVVITCYADYVPPPAVVTNGVYRLSGVMRTMDDFERYVVPTVPIEIDGFQVSPPEPNEDYLNVIIED